MSWQGTGGVRTLGAATENPEPWLAWIPRGERVSGQRARIAGHEVIVKAGPIRRPLRAAARSWTAGMRTPAELEFEHLSWLRRRLFRCVEPVAALSVRRAGRPIAQLFASASVPDARPFEAACREAGPEERGAWLRELGSELARMHALTFVHADLYARNILVAKPPPGDGPVGDAGYGRSLVFLDAWAGGVSPWTRLRPMGLERDLGTFLTEALEWLGDGEVETLLRSYAAGRLAQDRPVDARGRWLRKIAAFRRREIQRLAKRPARLRGRPLPSLEWVPPGGIT